MLHFYQTHSDNIYLKLTSLELTTERSYQTHSYNIHFKMTGLLRRFSRRRNMSSSRMHFCHINIGTEFKGKHILEQDEFYCAIISSGLKEKKKNFVLFSFLKTQDLYSILKSPRPTSPPQRLWISYQPTWKLTFSMYDSLKPYGL